MFSLLPISKKVFLVGSLVLVCSSAFLPTSVPRTNRAFDVQTATIPSLVPAQQRFPSTAIRVVADHPMKEDEKRKEESNDNRDDAWIPSEGGGFIPNIRARLGFRSARKPAPQVAATSTPKGPVKVREVLDIYQYKAEVADVRDQMVCVRFYAPWCKSCKAIEASFRRLPKDFPGVKFVEVPVNKDNAYLHKGLGVPSLPFGHIYHPSAGLVEERKINKHEFAEFKQILRTYVHGECPVQYDDDGNCVPM